MADHPGQSLPRQNQRWADLKAAYRFLHNPRVQPAAITERHRRLTRLACRRHPVILCVQDDSDLSSVQVKGDEHLMHHTLAVLPEGQLLGIVDQRFFPRLKIPAGETRKQRAARWRESDVWQDSVQAVGAPCSGQRFIHVADRAADNLRFMHACVRQGCDFVIRARQDRRVNQATDKLWPFMQDQPVTAKVQATLGKQSGNVNRPAREGRTATLCLRQAAVRLEQPSNHHEVHEGPLEVQALYLREEHPPAGHEPVEWLLLTSLGIQTTADALEAVSYYRKRWVIEEWHRALKEGCRLEASQVGQVEALYRLAALQSVMAVRLLQLRDLADSAQKEETRPVRRWLGEAGVKLVSHWARIRPSQLTIALFWRTLACRGGWIGRKSDGRPGWKTLWRGWHDLQTILMAWDEINEKPRPKPKRQSKTSPPSKKRCG